MRPVDPRLLRHARRARIPIAGVAVLGAATGGLIIVQAQLLADGITSGGTVTAVLVALAAVIVLRVAVAWATEAVSGRASSTVKAALREELLTRVTELGPRWLAGQRAGSLTTLATTGLDSLDGYFSRYLPQLVLGAVVPAAVVVRVGLADPLAGLTILGTLPLVPVFGALAGRATREHAERRWRTLAVLSHHFLDVVSGLPTLKVFGRAAAQRAEVGRVSEDYQRETLGTLRLAFLSGLVLELIATVSVALVAVGVGLSLVYGHLSLRTGLLALILAPEAYLPLRQAAAQFHATADGLAAAAEALTIIETPTPAVPAPAVSNPSVVTTPGTGAQRCDNAGVLLAIRVDGVSVRQPGRDVAAPDGVTLAVRPGEITVLTGPSGCGKSTLIDVLLGFATPSAGRVTVRRVEPSGSIAQTTRSSGLDCAIDTVRCVAGWVPQRPYLFPGTVASNIRLGWPDAPDEAVADAARAAAVDVPLDRAVTERDGGLSAGQRRRVALARALLPGRPVLLLDEPTAGLDPQTEDRVLDTLRREAAAGRAILVAAHHPRVIAIADHVVALGRVADDRADAAAVRSAGPRQTAAVPQ